MNNLEIGRLKKEDCKELIEFLNHVFTIQNNSEMHFENLYPRIFRPDDKMMGCHLAAKYNGKICGVVATYPFKYHIGGSTLTAGAAGNVAVDSAYRGQGIMQKLMNQIAAESKDAGIDFCYLHGDRWRYRNFGYERCGVEINFHIKASMLRNHTAESRLKLTKLTQDDTALIDSLYNYYKTQRTFEERDKETFYLALTAKGHITYAITSEKGETIGYITVTGGDQSSIIELSLCDTTLFADVLKTFLESAKLEVAYLSIPAYHEAVSEAFKYADRYIVFQPGNFLILNFKSVTEAFMREKAFCDHLPDGVLSIDSEIFGKWQISKCGENISVDPFDGNADFILEGHSVYTFMFGTLPPFGKKGNPEKEALAKAWFPLPLYGPYLS